MATTDRGSNPADFVIHLSDRLLRGSFDPDHRESSRLFQGSEVWSSPSIRGSLRELNALARQAAFEAHILRVRRSLGLDSYSEPIGTLTSTEGKTA